MAYDYVVVGAGAAGCVLANRLSEDPSVKVLVLDEGGHDRDPLIRIPKAFFFILGTSRRSYTYPTRRAGPDENVEFWQRGRIVGGSTSINGMQYDRSGPSFYDDLVARGNDGWGWKDMLPVFRSMEDHELGLSDTRGAGGPLPVRVTREHDELNEAYLAAGEKAGLRRMDDVNESEDARIGFMPNTIKNGVRVSAARAFLQPALGRPNLTYIPHVRAAHVLFDGNRAVGVRARHRGSVSDFRASQEVVLSSGAVETPLLLERSGIGRADVLAAAGIPLRVDSPNVGERVLEQRIVAYQVKINKSLGYAGRLSSPLRQAVTGAGYLATRSGVIATGAYDIAAFFKSDPDAAQADLIGIMNPFAMDLSATSLKVDPEPGISISGYLLHPNTASSVHVSGSEPGNPPFIDARFLETDHDQRKTVQVLDAMRDLVSQSPLGELVTREEAPGVDVQSDADIIRHSWASGHIAHAVGSAAMGPQDDDVVDHLLRVRGTRALRVVDASVLPSNPGNTAGPTMALSWRAADLIRQGNTTN